jgi:uncharacterized protein YegL
MTKRRFSPLALVAGAALVAACGSARDGFTPPPGPPPSLNGDGGTVEQPDADFICASAQRQAEPVPLAMLVLIDRSGSMAGEKWESATKAVRAFADRAEVVGMKMGLQFFPPMGKTSDECSPASYTNLAVPIAPLPDNVIPIQQRVTSVQADGGGTPMRSGLEGSIDAMRKFIATDSMHQGVVILVTDGDPSSCGSVANVASVAASGVKPLTDLPSIRTFAVGMDGASFASLDQIAQSGGSPKSFNVGTGVAAQQALVEALDEIRAGVISCEYTLPIPPASEGELDLGTVDLEFTPGANDPKATIRQVADLAACGATTGGFYYDDPKAPTKVVLCPASCAAVRGGTIDAKVDLVFGCIKKPK